MDTFSRGNRRGQVLDYMRAYHIDVSRGEIFLPADEDLARLEREYGADVTEALRPSILQSHVNPLLVPIERSGARVVSIGGVAVAQMRRFAKNVVYFIDGVVLTPDNRKMLGDLCAAVPLPPPPAEERAEKDKEPAEPSGMVAIQGDPRSRSKVNTKQLQRSEQPKSAKSGGRAPTARELRYIQAKRLQLLAGASDVCVPPPPPRLAPVSAEEVAWRKENLRDVARPGSMPDIPEAVLARCLPLDVALRPHQLEVIRYLLTHRGVMAAHSVGSGKTLIAASSALCVLRAGPESRVLFVAPLSLLPNFRRALETSFTVSEEEWGRIAFCTYEKFQGDYEKGLIDARGAFLIVDEAHRLRTQIADKDDYRKDRQIGEGKAKVAKCALHCARRAGKVLLLTATPVVNDPLDIANLVAMLRGELVPIAKREFHKKLFSKKGEVVSAAAFGDFLREVMHVYVRPQDGSYPAVEMHRVEIPMSGEYYQEYMRVEDQLITPLQLDVLGPHDLEPFYNGVRRTVNADIEEFNPKLDWVRQHLLRFNSRKMVIFSPFISLGVKQLELLVVDFDVKPAIGVITGDSTEEERQEVIDDYNANKIQILLISVMAGGLGINLLETRDVVVMQPGWNEVETQQAMGRAVRFMSHSRLPLGERRVDVWKLMLVKPPGAGGKSAADEIIEAITQRKQRLIDRFMDAAERHKIVA